MVGTSWVRDPVGWEPSGSGEWGVGDLAGFHECLVDVNRSVEMKLPRLQYIPSTSHDKNVESFRHRYLLFTESSIPIPVLVVIINS